MQTNKPSMKSVSNYVDAARANCAVIGIYGLKQAATLTYLGLYALQHRGQEATGIVSTNRKYLFRHAGVGLVSDVFKHKEVFKNLRGSSAIGHNRYSTTGASSDNNVQPLLVEDRLGPIGMSHNGNLINYKALRGFLENEGSIFKTSSDSELILQLMARSHLSEPSDRLEEAIRMIQGAYSLIILTREQMIAVRDPLGFRPLCLGKRNNGWVIASESCAFDLLDVDYVRDVQPGEMLIVDKHGLTSRQFSNEKKRAHCIFEYIYFSRPDSLIFGDNVDKTRRNLGHILAECHPVPGADIVVSVPDSSNTAALGYANEANLEFELGLIRNHYVGRTFIEPEQKLRDFGVKLKFNIVKGAIKGKIVVLVDDSIVRGTTLQKLVRLMRRGKAKEIHVRISSPPITNPCFYGMDFPTVAELAANKHQSIEGIRKFIRADTLEYLTEDELLKAVPSDNGQSYCTACFTGEYPISIPNENSPSVVKL